MSVDNKGTSKPVASSQKDDSVEKGHSPKAKPCTVRYKTVGRRPKLQRLHRESHKHTHTAPADDVDATHSTSSHIEGESINNESAQQMPDIEGEQQMPHDETTPLSTVYVTPPVLKPYSPSTLNIDEVVGELVQDFHDEVVSQFFSTVPNIPLEFRTFIMETMPLPSPELKANWAISNMTKASVMTRTEYLEPITKLMQMAKISALQAMSWASHLLFTTEAAHPQQSTSDRAQVDPSPADEVAQEVTTQEPSAGSHMDTTEVPLEGTTQEPVVAPSTTVDEVPLEGTPQEPSTGSPTHPQQTQLSTAGQNSSADIHSPAVVPPSPAVVSPSPIASPAPAFTPSPSPTEASGMISTSTVRVQTMSEPESKKESEQDRYNRLRREKGKNVMEEKDTVLDSRKEKQNEGLDEIQAKGEGEIKEREDPAIGSLSAGTLPVDETFETGANAFEVLYTTEQLLKQGKMPRKLAQSVPSDKDDDSDEEDTEFWMEDSYTITLEEAKRITRQEYLSTLSTTFPDSVSNQVAEEINSKYKSSLKHNYLLACGMEAHLSDLHDKIQRHFNTAAVREHKLKAELLEIKQILRRMTSSSAVPSSTPTAAVSPHDSSTTSRLELVEQHLQTLATKAKSDQSTTQAKLDQLLSMMSTSLPSNADDKKGEKMPGSKDLATAAAILSTEEEVRVNKAKQRQIVADLKKNQMDADRELARQLAEEEAKQARESEARSKTSGSGSGLRKAKQRESQARTSDLQREINQSKTPKVPTIVERPYGMYYENFHGEMRLFLFEDRMKVSELTIRELVRQCPKDNLGQQFRERLLKHLETQSKRSR